MKEFNFMSFNLKNNNHNFFFFFLKKDTIKGKKSERKCILEEEFFPHLKIYTIVATTAIAKEQYLTLTLA